MKFGNYDKINKIRKTEEELKKILQGTKMYCSNQKCKNTVIFNSDEMGRKIMCSKCHSGIFVKEKVDPKDKKTKKKSKIDK